MMPIGYPLFLAVVIIVFHSSCFDSSVYGKGQHSVYVVFECCYFMFVWVVRGKLDSGIRTCKFSVNTYVIIIVSVYSNVQVIY